MRGLEEQQGGAGHLFKLNQTTFFSLFFFVFLWATQCMGCKNSPKNRLSGFLRAVMGPERHGGLEDEVVTDGISGA